MFVLEVNDEKDMLRAAMSTWACFFDATHEMLLIS
jgi:hypothetical protein